MDVSSQVVETPAPEAEAWALLRSLFGLHRRRFLIAASELELHPAQAGALLQLSCPRAMNELAALLGCDNSNVTGLIDRLEARGLVARQASSADRRVKHVGLTAAGRELRDQMLARVGRPVEGFERLSADELAQLSEILRRVLGRESSTPGPPEAAPAERTGR